MENRTFKIIYSGLIAGFVSQGILAGLFLSPPVQAVLYNPDLQSQLFIEVTSARPIFSSVAGLVVLSIIHSWLYILFLPSIPGKSRTRKGCFWGFTIWLMYWVFQEWFIYHTLLQEPLLLNLLELAILLAGSLAEGIIISWFLYHDKKR